VWCCCQGNYKAALWAYQQVFAREPNNANAYELMGAMLIQQGRSEAIAALKSQQHWPKTVVCFAPRICLGEPGHHRWVMTLKQAAQVDPRNVKST